MPPLYSTGHCLYGAYLGTTTPSPLPLLGQAAGAVRDEIDPYGPVAVPSVLADSDRPLELPTETHSPPRGPPDFTRVLGAQSRHGTFGRRDSFWNVAFCSCANPLHTSISSLVYRLASSDSRPLRGPAWARRGMFVWLVTENCLTLPVAYPNARLPSLSALPRSFVDYGLLFALLGTFSRRHHL